MSATRDRYGEQLDHDEPTDQPHRCVDGWIDPDADHPEPCLTCKPHLAKIVQQQRGHP